MKNYFFSKSQNQSFGLVIGKFGQCLFLVFFTLGFLINPANAQSDLNKLTLTITPPLVKANVSPGDTWNSSVKVINNNNQPIKVFTEKHDFKSGEEGGIVLLAPPSQSSPDSQDFLLTQWLSIEAGPIEIPAQKSVDIPYTIKVPANAGPGGHYGLIFVGTKPQAEAAGTVLKVSSQLASIIMLTVRGETTESGEIREFSTDKSVYGRADVNFSVRFTNTGNVHLQPRGDIVIYDQWNKEKDRININHQSEFGNVLPQSTRQWQYVWTKGNGLLEMGRYRAMLVLSFGETSYETASQSLYFWKMNFPVLFGFLGGLAFLIILLVFLLRLYIRRAVKNAQSFLRVSPPPAPVGPQTLIIPAAGQANGGSINLKDKPDSVSPAPRRPRRKKLVAAGLAVVLVFSGYYFFRSGTEKAPALDGYPKINPVQTEEAPGEPVLPKEQPSSGMPAANKIVLPVITILNGSGQSGVAARALEFFASSGFQEINTGNADRFDYAGTIIKYPQKYAAQAEAVSQLFPIVVELMTDETRPEEIIVILGRDFSLQF